MSSHGFKTNQQKLVQRNTNNFPSRINLSRLMDNLDIFHYRCIIFSPEIDSSLLKKINDKALLSSFCYVTITWLIIT